MSHEKRNTSSRLNAYLLKLAYEFVAQNPACHDPLIGMDIAGLTIEEEESLTAAEVLDHLRAQTGSRADIITIAVLLDAAASGFRLLIWPTIIQQRAYYLLGIPPEEFARLDYFAFWPPRYQREYREAQRRGDLYACADAVIARVQKFILTKGRE